MDRKQSLLLVSAVAAGTALYNALKPIRSDVIVIDDFDIHKYLGTWYEIARMDFFWEKNLINVQANYSTNADGKILVTNSGYDLKKRRAKTSEGKAKFIRTPNEGALAVSFFGPFYSAYNIVHLDQNYQHALVFGKNTDYMWILSRTKELDDDIKKDYLAYARQCGFEVEKLYWTPQN